MNKRIKVYCLILAAVYVSIVAYNLIPNVDDFITGFQKGYEEGETGVSTTTYYLDLKAKSGSYTYPDRITNILNNESLMSEMTQIKIELPNTSLTAGATSTFSFIFKILVLTVGAFIYLGFIIYIPILFFSIVKSVTKNNILDRPIIRRVARMGWIIICIFLIETLFTLSSYFAAKGIMQFENYNIIVHFSDYILLVLGIVLLLLSEIMKFSLQLKEEQDLTI